MEHQKLFRLVLAAVFSALSCVATMLIHIPVPATNGYINLGDAVVLLGAFIMGPFYGAVSGGLGSMLADLLLGYAAYAPGTFVIKGGMALCAGLLFKRLEGRLHGAELIAAAEGEIIMVLGYFVYESLLLGYGLAAAVSMVSNSVQGLGGLVISVLLYKALYRVPAVRSLH